MVSAEQECFSLFLAEHINAQGRKLRQKLVCLSFFLLRKKFFSYTRSTYFLSEGLGVHECKQEVIKVVSFVRRSRRSTKCIHPVKLMLQKYSICTGNVLFFSFWYDAMYFTDFKVMKFILLQSPSCLPQ